MEEHLDVCEILGWYERESPFYHIDLSISNSSDEFGDIDLHILLIYNWD